MRNRAVYVAAVVLALVGLALFAYKWLFVGLPLNEGKRANAWQVEIDLKIEAAGGPVNAEIAVPRAEEGLLVSSVQMTGTGYGAMLTDDGVNRRAVFTRREAAGRQQLHVRYLVQRYPRHQEGVIGRTDRPLLVGETPRRHESAAPPPLSEAERAAAETLLQTLHERSANDRSMVSLLLSTLSAQQQAPTVRTLIGEDRSARRVATVAAAVLAARGFEARVTNGIDVAHTGRSVALVHWVEVLFDSRWIAFSVANGLPRLPDGYVPLWRGRTPMAVIDGGTLDTRRIAVQRLSRNELDQALLRGTEAGSTLVDFSLYILPTSVQALYRILLTVPIGVFILVILRNLIGIKGLGSFMPVLIALAFRETTLVWGIVLFVMIVSAGLAVRLYLEHLKLLLAPRLGAILMVVILMMAVVSVVAHKLGFDRGLSIALFPMVILTMTIERVSILWDERGPAAAMREAMQSLTIAALCYLAMSLPALQYLFFTFPELILVLLALTLLIGRYAGYRLLELPRFRAIIGDRSS